MRPLVGVIMGSKSDWETMRHAVETLESLGVPYEVRIVSAHRTPDLMFEYARTAESRGLEVIIAGAGSAGQANKYPQYRDALRAYRQRQTQAVLENPDPRKVGVR
jgi:phosphoribosylcarboxyaminoimidazole (NCAIR) mutase